METDKLEYRGGGSAGKVLEVFRTQSLHKSDVAVHPGTSLLGTRWWGWLGWAALPASLAERQVSGFVKRPCFKTVR